MCPQAHSIKTQQYSRQREKIKKLHQLFLSSCSPISNLSMDIESPRRTSSSSPEFNFWNLNNNAVQLHPPNLLTADELFFDGVLLPLHLLSLDPKPEPESKSEPDPETETKQSPNPDSSISSSNPSSPLTSSKRWKEIFKKKEPILAEEKEKKKDKKSNSGGGGGAAELNINIWPFARSRSAGTVGRARAKAAAAVAVMRKSSSAPCSRSNSRGENSGLVGRRWAASPGRAGVHVGRASPVWQVKRTTEGIKESKKPTKFNGGLGLKVNTCIGYRNQVRCREEGGEGNSGGLFRIKALFSKKVY